MVLKWRGYADAEEQTAGGSRTQHKSDPIKLGQSKGKVWSLKNISSTVLWALQSWAAEVSSLLFGGGL